MHDPRRADRRWSRGRTAGAVAALTAVVAVLPMLVTDLPAGSLPLLCLGSAAVVTIVAGAAAGVATLLLTTAGAWLASPASVADHRLLGILGVVALVIVAAAERRRLARPGRGPEPPEPVSAPLLTLFDLMPVGVAVADDAACRHIRVNPAQAALFGVDKERNFSVQLPSAERVPIRYRRDGRELEGRELPMQRAVATGTDVRDYEMQVVRGDGRTFDVVAYASPIRDAGGTPTGCVAAFVDVTTRKKAERALERSEAMLRLALESAAAGVWEWEVGKLPVWSPEIHALYGWDPRDAPTSYEEWLSRLYEPDREPTDRAVRAMLAGEARTAGVEYRIVHPGQEPRWLLTLGRTIVSADGRRRMTGITLDVTDRKRAEEAIRDSEDRLRTLAEAVSAIVARGTRHGVLTYVNAAFYRYTGASPDACVTDALRAATHPDDRPATLFRMRHALATGEPCELKVRLRRRDGAYRWFVLRCHPRCAADGAVEEWFATAVDVHDFLKSEAALASVARQRGMLLRLGQRALAAIDLRLLMQEAVAGVAQQLGTELVHVLELAADGTELCQRAAVGWTPASSGPVSVPAGPASHAGYTIALGTDHPVFVSDLQTETRFTPSALLHEHGVVSGVSVAIWGAGAPFGVLGAYTRRPRSFTDDEALFLRSVASLLGTAVVRMQLEAQRERARRAAEDANRVKDEFLATLSHELRTPLSAMLSWVSVLKAGRTDAETTREVLDGLERVAKTQARLINDLLDVSRIMNGKLWVERELFSIHEPVEAALQTGRRDAEAKGLRVRAEIDPDVGIVLGDAARIQQVASNLLTNAVKFTPEGGAVTVGLHRVGPVAELTVADSGIGIPAEVLPHVFDRFRQAESAHHRGGLGLGLSIVRYLVEAHGGSVAAVSPGIDGRGTTFTVRLPLVVPAEASTPHAWPETARPKPADAV